jgi:hypothetical protein
MMSNFFKGATCCSVDSVSSDYQLAIGSSAIILHYCIHAYNFTTALSPILDDSHI